MHLKELKLSGFKSFVDPTLIAFPKQLAAVVGPNGCGKSNIIDAVRWVMGESSAKTLRGESMTDVIFNGSLNRKPVGQASVELVFDNSFGRFAGQHANYQEISIKRLVTRDGDSVYYLNGSKCRRRDIFDIFLGTGAGAKGYAIIGQDMISKLVEARPEELKAYIEEAAGVSKYKERRRESLQRIQQTRENLDRVMDVREELHKQLQRLERQANAAEKYTLLKKEERHLRAKILALKWNALKKDEVAIRQEIAQLSMIFEKHQAKLAQYLNENQTIRTRLQELRDQVQEVQGRSYQKGTQIARLEEHLNQQRRENERLSADLQQIRIDLEQSKAQIALENQNWQACMVCIEELMIKFQNLKDQLHIQQEEFNHKQQEERTWKIEWQNLQTLQNQNSQKMELAKLHVQNLEQRRQKNILNMEKLLNDKKNLDIEPLQNEVSLAAQQVILLQQEYSEHISEQEKLLQGESNLQREITDIEKEIHAAQDVVQKLSSKHAALKAAQQAALHTRDGGLSLANVENLKRLFAELEVEEKWINTCEFVLEDGLNAFILDDEAAVISNILHLKKGPAVFVTEKHRESKEDKGLLIDKIRGKLPHWFFPLENIFAVDSLKEALDRIPDLQPMQSIVTPDGFWLGKGWMKAANFETSSEVGLLQQKQALINTKAQLEDSQKNLNILLGQRKHLHQHLMNNRQQLEEHHRLLASQRTSLHQYEAEKCRKEHLLEQSQFKLLSIASEEFELQQELESITVERIEIDQKLLQTIEIQKQCEEQTIQLQVQYDMKSQELENYRSAVESLRAGLQQLELQKEKEQMRAQQYQDSIHKEKLRLNKLNEQQVKVENSLKEMDSVDALTSSLAEQVVAFREMEDELLLKRRQLDEQQFLLDVAEQESQKTEQEVKKVQEKIQEQSMFGQSLEIRSQGLYESLTELEVDVQGLLKTANEVELPACEQLIIQLGEKINRLGPVNLVAIQEYEVESERKRHLDEQYLDLTHAIETLQAAIIKMDKETELRLQGTFEQVNAAFQKLFPRLFGGGRAKLQLTCDNLLEAGVTVIAQPPGKRNSTIHMLSGGEKAMTAVALVFAIFQLNPSPFCMLDEVDAPLDDANVHRFCEMVKEMSEFVQFLFITHNKVTMEMANHLIGVTMREPGVSRIVSVDVEQALSIVE
jgi:chromosome segregation protein